LAPIVVPAAAFSATSPRRWASLSAALGEAGAAKRDADHLSEILGLDADPLAGALQGAAETVDLGFDLATALRVALVHLGTGELDSEVVLLFCRFGSRAMCRSRSSS
jgi:hypothetical protein